MFVNELLHFKGYYLRILAFFPPFSIIGILIKFITSYNNSNNDSSELPSVIKRFLSRVY